MHATRFTHCHTSPLNTYSLCHCSIRQSRCSSVHTAHNLASMSFGTGRHACSGSKNFLTSSKSRRILTRLLFSRVEVSDTKKCGISPTSRRKMSKRQSSATPRPLMILYDSKWLYMRFKILKSLRIDLTTYFFRQPLIVFTLARPERQ